MCLAVPMRIVSLEGERATAEADGVTREVDTMLIENPKLGEYVLVHAGFAIERVDEEEAEKTLELLRELAGHMEEAESG